MSTRPAIAPIVPFQEATTGMGATAANPYTPGHWSQSLILRICLGVFFALSVNYVLRRSVDIALILLGIEVEPFWGTMVGFIALQVSQALALLIATMLASAGRGDTLTLGLLIGVTVGFITMLLMPLTQLVPQPLYFMMPAWHALAGATGAKLGEWIWHPPLVKRQAAASGLQQQEDLGLFQVIRNALVGMVFANIRWLRVIFATALILGALWYTDDFVKYVIRYFNLATYVLQEGVQKRVIVLMLQGAVVVLAATLAGATTMHGIAHGFWTGVIAGVINLLRYVFFRNPTDPIDVIGILSEIGWVWIVCVVAGGFGAHVLPPLSYLAQKRRVNPSNIQVPVE